MLTMYMGDPHNVAAIMLLWRYRAKPKSAGNRGVEVLLVSLDTGYHDHYHTLLLFGCGGVNTGSISTLDRAGK